MGNPVDKLWVKCVQLGGKSCPHFYPHSYPQKMGCYPQAICVTLARYFLEAIGAGLISAFRRYF